MLHVERVIRSPVYMQAPLSCGDSNFDSKRVSCWFVELHKNNLKGFMYKVAYYIINLHNLTHFCLFFFLKFRPNYLKGQRYKLA